MIHRCLVCLQLQMYILKCEYQLLMPAFEGDMKQLINEQISKSRLVTKIRWVVEAIHGALLHWNDIMP